tara:strand:+ start:6876 stop:7700 length:825 start_codon:yes stop_codon:yes gene_type:complete
MKVKHNKKRNTAFLFEALLRELTKSVVSQQKSRTKAVKKILSEHFRKGDILNKEMDCYNALAEDQQLDRSSAEKMVHLAKQTYAKLSEQDIFKEQSQVIKKINTVLGKEVFNHFVPNYKSFATIAQIFGDKSPLKSRVLMENKLVEGLMSSALAGEKLEPVDSLTVKAFAERFNQHYSDLLTEQKELLGKYIVSFGNSSVDFKLYIAEELKRIHSAVSKSLEMEEVKEDAEMTESTKKILKEIEAWNISKLTEAQILKILKLQKLIEEYHSDDN